MNESFVRAPVRIEDDVWIGAHSVIFPGVVLGRGSVVGAGSIVTRDVEPFSIVAGVPAKVLRKRKNNLSK
jgi:galactoside O-acetyltransferase